MENIKPPQAASIPETQSEPQEVIKPLTQQTVQGAQINKWFISSLFLVILLLLGLIGYFVYQNHLLRQQLAQSLPTPTPSLAPSPSPTPSPTQQNWLTYVSEKIVDYFKPFKLYYPPSWNLETKGGTNPPWRELTLEKNEFIIRILQAPGSEASCLYPEDAWIEGMFAKYGEYKEIKKSNNLIWRRAMPESQIPNKVSYKVCEKTPESDFFVGATGIGVLSLQGPSFNQQILNEFDEILEKVEILD